MTICDLAVILLAELELDELEPRIIDKTATIEYVQQLINVLSQPL